MSDIPDLVPAGDPEIYGPTFILERINQRHRHRVAEITTQRDGAADEGLRLRGILDTKADEIERLRADRDRILAQSNCYGAKVERLQPELDNAHQTIAKLQLDVGILNGRLIERTESMGERQREYLDRARKAESVAREALGHLETLAGAFLEASECANQPLRHAVIWREAASDVRKRVKALTVRLETSTACGQSADKTTEPASQTEGGVA